MDSFCHRCRAALKRTFLRWILFTLIFASPVALRAADETARHNALPKSGAVPTEEVAIKIAVAVWEPIYGAEKIAAEKPFHARLANGVWTVQGSLPKGWKGGVAIAEIAQADARIIRISHGK